MFREQESANTKLLDPQAVEAYRRALQALIDARFPFLVGGTFAMAKYTGIVRDTKDLDLFVLPADIERTLDVLARSADHVDLTYPHWLGKAHYGPYVIDIVFSSGNGLCRVDRGW